MFDKLPVPCATLDTMLSVRCVLAHKPAPPTTVALISHLAPDLFGICRFRPPLVARREPRLSRWIFQGA